MLASAISPVGSGCTGIRNVAYFGGIAILKPLLVLAAHALIGGALAVAAVR